MKDQVNDIIRAIALAACFIPFAIVLARKLQKDVPLFVFALYYAAAGLINLVVWGFNKAPSVQEDIWVSYNMLDVPFVLTVLYLNSSIKWLKKLILFFAPAYLLIEIVYALSNEFSLESFKYCVGFGVAIILIAVLLEIVRYFRTVEHAPRENAMIIIYLAVLFQKSTYVIVYAFTYFVNADLRDVNLISHLSMLFGVGIASFGFLSKGLTHKEPPKPVRARNEVLITIID